MFLDPRFPGTFPISERFYEIADTRFDGERWSVELIGRTNELRKRRGEINSNRCPYVWGSDDCGADVDSFTEYDVAVTEVLDKRRSFRASGIPSGRADDFFGKGFLQFSIGSNTALSFEVKSYTQATREFVLVERTPFDIAVGDTFTAKAGCRKRYQEDCIDKFVNGINYGGDALAPTTDEALETPQR